MPTCLNCLDHSAMKMQKASTVIPWIKFKLAQLCVVGKEFFEERCITFREWALSACNCYYYGDELLVYALCQIFYHHAVIACYDCLWTTIDSQYELTIGEILDVCDVHLAFLHPGMFGDPKLKKRHGTMPLPSVDPSPPEFPAWSNTVQSIVNLPGLQCFIDSDLLQTYLNIKPEPPTVNKNETEHMPDVRKNTSLSLTGRNIPQMDKSESVVAVQTLLPLNGGNNDIINQTQGTVIKGVNSHQEVDPDNLLPVHPLINTSSTIIVNTEEVMVTVNNEEVASPVGLKKTCIQSLMDPISHTNPMSLFETCVDILSWNLEQYFPCSMKLLWSLNTGTHVLELQQIKHQPSPTPKLADVILYDRVCVHPLIKDLWLRQVNTRKYCVPLSKLTAAQITAWQHLTNATSWENIDPYSSLEDTGTTSSEEENHTDLESGQMLTNNDDVHHIHLQVDQSGRHLKMLTT